jgi:predicted DNA-binding protein with PD1-like motif
LEVTIIEIDGIAGTRQLDPGSGMKLLRLKEDRTA